MSTQEMTKEQSESLDHLMQHHYAPVFVKRCAERGLNIESEAHLHRLLETAAKVKMANEKMGSGGQQQLTDAADHQLNVAFYGEEKAAEIAAARQQADAPATEPTDIPEATKQALASLLTPPVEKPADATA